MNKAKGILLDADSVTGKENESIIRLYVKGEKGIEIFEERSFKPYFYVIVEDVRKAKKELMEREFEGKEEKIRILNAEEVKKKNAENVLKLSFNSTNELSEVREQVKEVEGVKERREYDIIFVKRYLIDKALEPMNYVEISYRKEGKKKVVEKIQKGKKEAGEEFKTEAIDLETFSLERFSDPRKDAILMISIASPKESLVVTTKKELKGRKGVKIVGNEKEMIEELKENIKEEGIEILVTYNGDTFDLPYLKERSRIMKTRFDIGIDGSEPQIRRKGLSNATRIKGIQHFDAYQLIRILSRFGIIDLVKYDLESVVEALYGEKKEKIKAEEITKIWESGKGLEKLVEYNREDSVFTLKIAMDYLPLFIELSKLVKQTLFEVNRIGASGLVESLLIDKGFEEDTLVPNKPNETEVKNRMMKTFKGGYVKEPTPGLHEEIAVLDFRSLHPSIMISHNVSPETLNCECCSKSKKNIAPTKDYFCSKKSGFLPSVQKELLERRKEIKKESKKLERKSEKYKLLDARQHALKIILNSFYGYLGYPRSRWYSIESAKAVTAWSRHYIRETIRKSEEDGFKAIYSDTDSCFIVIPKEKTAKNVNEFIKKVNAELPGEMELELEGIYKRGIFVTKKIGGAAAKKRYALIDGEGNLKIVGFEYVRRDWAVVAKETQKRVIELVLKEGKPEKAIEEVKEKIKRLREGKTPKKELVIYTQIKKPLSQYESIGPHVSAARKAIKKGKNLGIGSIIGYIVTKSGKSISDKAELEEFVKEGNYDADYYIEHQLVPAVIKIIQELGYGKEDLIHGGKQATLNAFK
ncbi:MAG: DNA-directed DNA polymerase [archaeon]|nr:DNA-directed DNA polymerase [Candidatus Micrarchaeota archaeon]